MSFACFHPECAMRGEGGVSAKAAPSTVPNGPSVKGQTG